MNTAFVNTKDQMWERACSRRLTGRRLCSVRYPAKPDHSTSRSHIALLPCPPLPFPKQHSRIKNISTNDGE
ncbi:hypothetical protein C1X65_04300 [Pseudomonas sp. FW305-70]|nr:hypothetical protein C1X65_04300 [Pseudomonas sp. FW305-70]